MTESFRTFISITVPENLKGGIGSLLERLKEEEGSRVRWIKADSAHVTLKFLGDVDQDQVEPIIVSLTQSVEGIHPFTVKIREMSAFPNPAYPKVIWLGLSESTGRLKELVTRVNDGLERFGFEREDRGFHPHLTLGRVKSLNRKGPLIRKIQEFRNHEIGSMEVDRIFLMRSDLNPRGAVHMSLGEIPFSVPH